MQSSVNAYWRRKQAKGEYMCSSEGANKAAKNKPDTKRGESEKCPLVAKIKVIKVEVDVDLPNDIVFMNDPNTKVLATAKITYRDDSTDPNDLSKLPKIRFSFSDPGNNNAQDTKSFDYGGKKLGKRDNAAAIYWAAHADSSATSADNFKLMAKVTATPETATSDEKTAIAKIWFMPSGVGGDNFKLLVHVFKADGTTEICDNKSKTITVWRQINFNNIYTMDSETYINTATTVANINPAFKTSAYVEYEQGTVTKLGSTLTVKYLGLYKKGGGTKTWPTDFSPTKLESTLNEMEPTQEELDDYAGTDVTKKALAKSQIEAKALLWFNAIVSDYNTSISDFISDSGVSSSSNTLLAVQYYHPKLSGLSDGATSFWPAGITINLANPGSGLTNNGDPDRASWRTVQGFNSDKIVVIFKNYGTAARLQIICRHEIGHATKSEFERDNFGTGDHSATKLMTPYGGASTFSSDDIKILRGLA